MSDSLSLQIERGDRGLFPVRLCDDLNLGQHPGVPSLRFFLCFLSECPIIARKPVIGMNELTPDYLGLTNLRRRTNALFGQACLGALYNVQQYPLGYGMKSVASYPGDAAEFIRRLTYLVKKKRRIRVTPFFQYRGGDAPRPLVYPITPPGKPFNTRPETTRVIDN